MIVAFALGMALGMALGIGLTRDAVELQLLRAGLLRPDNGSAGEPELRWCGAEVSASQKN